MYNGILDNQMFQIEPNQILCKKIKKGLDRNQKNYNVRALVKNSGHYIQTKITAEISGKLYIQNLSGSTQSPKRDILTRTELHNPNSNL